MTIESRAPKVNWPRPFALRIAAAVCLFVCASAGATPITYLELPGVTGPVTAPGFSGDFDVDAFAFSIEGVPPFSPLLDVLVPSAEDAALILAAESGKHFPLIHLDAFTDNSSTADYTVYSLTDAQIAAVGSGVGVPDVQIDISFGALSHISGTCGTNGVPCPSSPSVPEPETLALLGLGLLGVGLSRRTLAR